MKNVFEQEGFSRQKRGYRNINDIEVNMSDPLFTKQWYLVSNQPSSCLHDAWPLAPTHILSPQLLRGQAYSPLPSESTLLFIPQLARPTLSTPSPLCIHAALLPPLLFTLTGKCDVYATASLPSSVWWMSDDCAVSLTFTYPSFLIPKQSLSIGQFLHVRTSSTLTNLWMVVHLGAVSHGCFPYCLSD